jgi:Gpi18-like mannosyltransferase
MTRPMTEANTAPSPRSGWPHPAVAAAIGILSLWLHLIAWPTVAPDMVEFVGPWYQNILDKGPVGAFADPFSNYTPAYLYVLAAASPLSAWLEPISVIKLVSVLGTGLLAWSIYRLLETTAPRWRATAAFATFLLPTPLLNGPFLGQCDVFWVTACIMAVAAALRDRTVAMLVWCGVAISFKAQAAFLAPFIIALLIHRRTPLHLWLIPPAVYAGFAAPAWLAGWPAFDLLMVYPRQTTHFDTGGNLANPWAVLRYLTESGGKNLFWVGYMAGLVAVGAYLARFSRLRLDRTGLIAAALLSAFMLPWLLPKMHERYWLLADMLAFAFALSARDRSATLIAVTVNLASALSIFSYVTAWRLPVVMAAVLSGFALLALVEYLARRSDAAKSTSGRDSESGEALVIGAAAVG